MSIERPRFMAVFPDGRRVEAILRSPLQSAAGAIGAVLTGRKVADEVRVEREGTCAGCEHVRKDARGMFCNLCGCGIGGRILNLAAYEEELPGRGCKHPERGQGKGWKR